MNKTEQIALELQVLAKSETKLKRELAEAEATLTKCRNMAVSGEGGTQNLIRAQSAFDAISGACNSCAAKLDAKLIELDEAKKAAQLEADRQAFTERVQSYNQRQDALQQQCQQCARALDVLPTIESELASLSLESERIFDEATRLDQRAEIKPIISTRNAFLDSLPPAVREGIFRELDAAGQRRVLSHNAANNTTLRKAA